MAIKTAGMVGGALHRFNRVIGLDLNAPATPADLDHIGRYYAGVAQFRIDLSPLAAPAELGAWLEARGMEVLPPMARLVRGFGAQPPVATSLRIIRVGADQAAAFGRVRAAGFGLPPAFAGHTAGLAHLPGWTSYMAFAGAEPVGVALLFCRDGVGWLGGGAVLEPYRGRGGQSALLALRVRDARAAGCTILTTETAIDRPGSPSASSATCCAPASWWRTTTPATSGRGLRRTLGGRGRGRCPPPGSLNGDGLG